MWAVATVEDSSIICITHVAQTQLAKCNYHALRCMINMSFMLTCMLTFLILTSLYFSH